MDDVPETLADFVLRDAASLGVDEHTISELRTWLIGILTRSESSRQIVLESRSRVHARLNEPAPPGV